MGTFDDIFEGIDEITSPEERPQEAEKLTVSEAEQKMGVWNAQDDGDAWSSDPTPNRSIGRGAGVIPKPYEGPKSPSMPKEVGELGESDDWAQEDEILEDFVSEDEEYDSGGGSFDDLF